MAAHVAAEVASGATAATIAGCSGEGGLVSALGPSAVSMGSEFSAIVSRTPELLAALVVPSGLDGEPNIGTSRLDPDPILAVDAATAAICSSVNSGSKCGESSSA